MVQPACDRQISHDQRKRKGKERKGEERKEKERERRTSWAEIRNQEREDESRVCSSCRERQIAAALVLEIDRFRQRILECLVHLPTCTSRKEPSST